MPYHPVDIGDAIGGLLTAITSGVVLGIAFLLILYRMIDGDIPAWAGLSSMGGIIILLLMSVKPPHPAIPAVVLVVALSLMAFFPYAEGVLERQELRAIDTARLDRSYAAFASRPDNFASRLQLAESLYLHGLPGHAIAIASSTMDQLSTQMDPVSNRSLRDVFRNEDIMVKKWIAAQNANPKDRPKPIACPTCKRMNSFTDVFCPGCQRPYLLDAARNVNVRGKVIGKLVVGWVAVAGFIVAGAAIGLSVKGPLQYAMYVGASACVVCLLAWLFRPPKIR